MNAPAAVLFDMDGTLVDTEVLWWETTERTAERLGHRLGPADAPEVVGRAVPDTAAHLVRVAGRGEPAEVAAELTEGFFRRVCAGAPLRPGAQRLLTALEAEGIPFALVSASPRVVVDQVVGGALAHVPFAFTLSADDTVRTKPHPEPYRAAAARLGLAPERCVAVEDSPDGAASAEAAGCALLVVPSLLDVPRSAARTFAASLEEVTPELLRAMTGAGPAAQADRTSSSRMPSA
ncbi:HAD family hydrolase [Streptomyces lavendulae]|uniref:Sugar phosphatase YfbT n=2 Tax=Streptomyces lavendulae TaxID=1914 RepID=A0A2K8PS49_STRLA|nr:HAD family phosphatase [Streptomyces lavendulae]ATZ28455.1 Sugar phosphatase YfbT [Streptomyces lavendulae subsp. lavendulae]QUQ58282.1 Hexitol phosphatase A [Streptomyces lavendulae subsp. lavendulae]GLV99033.1 hydrolase [Streptomyces lavendulae subsp. lavendulae]GLX39733.1 hydrolase [Streptomyces roseochromogenus]